MGLRQQRVTGAEYDSFIDEFMEAVVKRYGQNVLIQFEDFGNHNAFRFLDRFRGQYCTFNDDIQGTASVAVAGLLASRRITGKKISENKFLFLGAGEAAIGIADLCVKAMEAEGTPVQDARDKIWMVDIDGLLAKGRPEGKLEGHKAFYAKDHPPVKNLSSVVKEIKPSVMIGRCEFSFNYCLSFGVYMCSHHLQAMTSTNTLLHLPRSFALLSQSLTLHGTRSTLTCSNLFLGLYLLVASNPLLNPF